MKIHAAIDIGSQTIRLLVAQRTNAESFIPLFKDRAIIRLGEGMSCTRELKKNSIKRAADCISFFVRKACEYKSEAITAVATACVRNASNTPLFLKHVKNRAGITPFVISGTQEAFLVSRAVETVISKSAYPRLIVDIGGGSTELVFALNRKEISFESLPLGVISLAERHLKHDPPEENELKKMKSEIVNGLKKSSSIIDITDTKMHLSGTAGTLTTLAAMDMKLTEYLPDRINGHILSFEAVRKILLKMLRLHSSKRALLPGLEKGREIVIVAGNLLLLELMKTIKKNSITVSDSGLLEGIIIEKTSPVANIFDNSLKLT